MRVSVDVFECECFHNGLNLPEFFRHRKPFDPAAVKSALLAQFRSIHRLYPEGEQEKWDDLTFLLEIAS